VAGNGPVVLSGAVSSSSTTSIIKQGNGTLTLSGTADNSYLVLDAEGGTTILNKTSSSSVHAVAGISNIATGATVQLSGPGGDQIYDGSAYNVTLGGGTLDMAGKSESFNILAGNGTVTDSSGGR
jgi:hypothetical protein